MSEITKSAVAEVRAELDEAQKRNEASVKGTKLSAGALSDGLKEKIARAALEKHREAIFDAAVAEVVAAVAKSPAKV